MLFGTSFVSRPRPPAHLPVCRTCLCFSGLHLLHCVSQ